MKSSVRALLRISQSSYEEMLFLRNHCVRSYNFNLEGHWYLQHPCYTEQDGSQYEHKICDASVTRPHKVQTSLKQAACSQTIKIDNIFSDHVGKAMHPENILV